MNKASLKKILKKKIDQSIFSVKSDLLETISEELTEIGVLAVGVSYSPKDDLEFLELYSKIAKNRAVHFKREANNKERKSQSTNFISSPSNFIL